jgi:hypothetical protein
MHDLNYVKVGISKGEVNNPLGGFFAALIHPNG